MRREATGRISAKEGYRLTYALNGSLQLLGLEWTLGDKSGSRQSSEEVTTLIQGRDDGHLKQSTAVQVVRSGQILDVSEHIAAVLLMNCMQYGLRERRI